MTQDEIIRMAMQAGFEVDEGLFPFEAAEDKYIGTERTLERFAALVAAHEREKFLNKLDGVSEKVIYETVKEAVLAEREACAKFCETQRNDIPATGEEFAAAIRTRSN